MNKLKGKFRAWKSGKHWMYAGTMVIIATGMCTAKVTLADTSALEKQGNNNNDGRAYLNR
ncbi:TPA: KxYKxGKxW signal peptide domain-containing protein, partial [Streptococcus pyogenes]|nr:KxYKxGKxW signal peptide domain-containing protein [Streptococcus pyogenes]